ncbi:2-hydroxyacid dehydrogenase [Paracoccus shanxieyensis]|uniref:2-hydroxyacid dehydrogenase n=1 Tax=Paracoccus shanxieyensis TaxID=2675752 RepID=A0A6L6J1Y3_9RHOB|nr:2-hydroxyacid dehydrogenase [Paracoccus shanxieyensis]MTH65280.1 2-hydroxyacid dehydrogenase [Paracoccus shanxieyensis]MTH88416.1 2-hydroxyacid dehydrogenase [Paracoccus shanxieyensis]
MAKVLAIGPYADIDAQALRDDFAALPLADAADVAGLSADQRDKVVAVAFLGHKGMSAAVMDQLPNLRFITNFGVGYDAIDIAGADARGIRVTNTPNVLNDDVADLAVAMLISENRRMSAAETWMRAGEWAKGPEYPLQRKMSGRKVGILGLGRIGREIADRLAAFRTQIHYFSRSDKQVAGWTWHDDPVALAHAVDDLVIAVVGGPDTTGIVSAKVIKALGPDGIIVNIARGSVIDETALLDALEAGRLRGAALDVFLNEPRPDPRFFALKNATLLPHVGSATQETRRAMGELQRRNLRLLLDGEQPETPVN